MLDPLALTRRFIDIPSVTGDESAMAEAAAAVLRGIGFDVQFHLAAPGRPNVLATLDAPRVLLCSHLDTVPPFFPARDEGDYIYGRGACDTKGILAAMAGAAERLVQSGVRDVGLLWVVGEETDSIGAKCANADLQLPDVRFTLVGEPTESKYALAQKGGLKWTLRVHGAAAHSGYPERGQSAIDELVRLIGVVNGTDWGTTRCWGRGPRTWVWCAAGCAPTSCRRAPRRRSSYVSWTRPARRASACGPLPPAHACRWNGARRLPTTRSTCSRCPVRRRLSWPSTPTSRTCRHSGGGC